MRSAYCNVSRIRERLRGVYWNCLAGLGNNLVLVVYILINLNRCYLKFEKFGNVEKNGEEKDGNDVNRGVPVVRHLIQVNLLFFLLS